MPLDLVPPSSATPVSVLFTYQQFVNRFGLSNIIKASNKDSSQQTPSGAQAIPAGQPNWYAVQDAFNFATEEVYSKLRGGVLKVPLDFSQNANVVPIRVGRWAMIIAYCDLYDMRINATDKPRHATTKMEKMLAGVYDEMAGYRGGQPGFQMWEAVQATDQTGTAVTVKDVMKASGEVRFIDGTFTFIWV